MNLDAEAPVTFPDRLVPADKHPGVPFYAMAVVLFVVIVLIEK